MARKKKTADQQVGQVFVTTSDHKQLSADLVAVIKKYEKRLIPLEILAICSHMVGSVLALVDDRNVKSGLALDTVQRNMDAGNEEAHMSLDPLLVMNDKPATPEDPVN